MPTIRYVHQTDICGKLRLALKFDHRGTQVNHDQVDLIMAMHCRHAFNHFKHVRPQNHLTILVIAHSKYIFKKYSSEPN